MSEMRVLSVKELPLGAKKIVEAGGSKILVINDNGVLCAVQAECPHAGAPLEEGVVCQGRLTCPWHLATFALPTGELVEPPAMDGLKTYAVRSDDDSIFVETEARQPEATLGGHAANQLVFLLVGAGAAGSTAAKTLRQGGFTGGIVIVDPVEDEPVDRTQLSKDALAGRVPLSDVKLDIFSYLDAKVIHASVTDFSAAQKEVRLDNGVVIRFDKALVATGGRPKRLSVPGTELAHTIRHSGDVRRILEAATPGKKAVIVGTSFIGMEAASALVQRGLQVTVVGPEKLPFAKQFGAEVAGALMRVHERGGTKFKLGLEVTGIPETDLVILGVGVTPELGFAHDLPLAKDGGIATDERLRASDCVWVAGDIASVNGLRIEHWRVAQQHGRAAALAMLGGESCYRGVPYFWTYHFGRRLGYLGHASEWDETVIHGDLDGEEFMVFYLKDSLVKAVLNCGMETQMASLSEPMRGPLTLNHEPVRNIILRR
jgi:NADPH-dependent 2,4-dienoyl-CoA reductase/sulfur reductase-like enzyme/nitrite reductase/ring-hydroxylating ferredoxin subunit